MRRKHTQNQGEELENGLLTDEKEQKRKENRKYAIVILVNTVVIYGLYVILIELFPAFSEWILAAYLVALSVISVVYVVYNRAFTRKNLTVEMLPLTWSEAEKIEYIEDGKRRMKKSKWCITLIFPLGFTFFMDIFYLFIYQEYFAPVIGKLF